MRFNETLKKVSGLFVEQDEPSSTDSLVDAMMRSPAPPTSAPSRTPSPTPDATAIPTVNAASAQPRTVEDVVRAQPGPNLDEIKVVAPAPTTPTEPVIGPDGSVNFGAIYGLAKLPASALTAEAVLELLASLPAELPIQTKRTTLKVTIDAMSKSLHVSSEGVVADASRKLAALAAFSDSYTDQVGQYVTKCELEIANLEAEIARRKAAIGEAQKRQAAVQEACKSEVDRLDDVLEFFSLDVAPSKYATPS